MVGTIGKAAFGGLVLLLLAGCGGSTAPEPGDTSLEGAFVGSGLVSGLHYQCGKYSGRTSKFGAFDYEDGEGCTFRIGGLFVDASSADLEDGIITPYDLTGSKEAAWTLSAIIQSVFAHTIRDVLIPSPYVVRVKSVDLSAGEAAVAEALSRVMNLTPKTLAAAKAKLDKRVDSDSHALVLSYESLKEQATLVGASHNDVTVWATDRHQDPLYFKSVENSSPVGWESDWYNSGTEKPSQKPTFQMDLEQYYVVMDFEVHRSKSTTAGTWFTEKAMGTLDGSTYPYTSHALGLDLGSNFDQTKNTVFPQELNLAVASDWKFTMDDDGGTVLTCTELILGQGSQTTLKSITNTTLDIGYTVFDVSDGDWIGAVLDVAKDVWDIITLKVHENNWWATQNGENNEVYKTSIDVYQGDGKTQTLDAVLFECADEEDNPIAAKIWQNGEQDDSFSLTFQYPVPPDDLCEVSGNSYKDDDGTLWYGGNPGDSCDETCLKQQLSCDPDKTVSIGSGGSDTDCRDMLKNLGSANHDLIRYTDGNDASGCGQVEPHDPTNCDKFVVDAIPKTTCGASHDTRCRACACS